MGISLRTLSTSTTWCYLIHSPHAGIGSTKCQKIKDIALLVFTWQSNKVKSCMETRNLYKFSLVLAFPWLYSQTLASQELSKLFVKSLEIKTNNPRMKEMMDQNVQLRKSFNKAPHIFQPWMCFLWCFFLELQSFFSAFRRSAWIK